MDTDRGWSSGSRIDFTADSLLGRSKQNVFRSLWHHHGFTQDRGAPAFVARDILNHLLHILAVVGVEVYLQPLIMTPLCLHDASFQS